MSDTTYDRTNYRLWLDDLKSKVHAARLKTAVAVNVELLFLYWEMGREIVAQQLESKWGDGFLAPLSRDLSAEFPGMKGFSRRNLELIRQWHLFYCEHFAVSITKQPVSQFPAPKSQHPVDQFGQQPVALIMHIPWGHNIAIIAKCKTIEEALYYVQNTVAHGWSRSVLVHQIENRLFQREGRSVNNFSLTLPTPQSELARQTIKDPYVFDFLDLTKEFNERELERSLLHHMKQFLLELGAGFAFVGSQVPLAVGEKEYFLDLLFYHTHLHCFVVVEIKAGDFEPEYAGKLNFYLRAVDEHIRSNQDASTIGIMLCKKKNALVAEYALSDIHKPIGISEYQLTRSLPDDLKPSLPSIEELEREFGDHADPPSFSSDRS